MSWVIAAIVATAACVGCAEAEPAYPPSTHQDHVSVPLGSPADGCDHTVVLVDRDVAVVAGRSETITFDVSPSAVSVAVTVVGDPELKHGYSLAQWTQPDGDLVYDGWHADGEGLLRTCVRCRLLMNQRTRTFSASAPAGPDSSLVAGPHDLSVRAVYRGEPVDDVVRVRVLAKVVPGGLPDTGVVHLNIHHTGANGWTAAAASSNDDVERMLAGLAHIYRQAGITLGAVTYVDIDEHWRAPATDDLAPLMGLGTTVNHHVDVFVIDAVGDDQSVRGVSGGVPGPPLLHGVERAGIVIPTAFAEPGMEHLLAHELGHFLGLFHVRQPSPSLVFGQTYDDPLPDTTNDPDELMHAQTRQGTKLSRWQGIVMRSSPWVCHP